MTEENKKAGAPRESQAMQRHADYYVGFLMSPEHDREQIYPEMGQIALALSRVKEERVGTGKFHPAQVEMKYREMAGGYAETFLPALMRGEATNENFAQLETAMQMVETGDVAYPANAKFLRGELEKVRQRLAAKMQ